MIKHVWDLYAATIKLLGAISTMIERDDNIPDLSELLIEVEHARSIAAEALGETDHCLI